MYRNTAPLCCVPGTNSVVRQLYFNKQTNSSKKRPDLWLSEAEGGGRKNWMKVVKKYKLSVVRQILGI